MPYQVLARKYRPQRFQDVIGQEHVTQTLVNAIHNGRIAHAYLFAGPRGTGKTTLARIFAKCLNCTDGPKADFSDQDIRCQEIAEGRSLDVLEIDGASNRGIEEIRELRETVKYAPASSRFKIYIIDEVHMLTKEAFNALLKTLEEPPAHVKFMFATTEPEKVLPTILSRCQRFDLRRIPSALIVKHLAHLAALEGVQVEEAALYAVARGADGCMRDAESTLEQLISFCDRQISEADVLSMFGLSARNQILSLASAVLGSQLESALCQLGGLAEGGKDLGRLLSDLLNHFRNLLLYVISRGNRGLLEVSEAELDALTEQAKAASPETLMRILEVLTEVEGRLRDTASKRILVEVALMKMVQARNSVEIDTVLKTLQQLRTEAAAAGSQPGAAPAAASVASGSMPAEASSMVLNEEHAAPPQPAGSPEGAAVALPHLWREVVQGVGRASPFARTYLLEAHPVSLIRNVLTIGFDPEFADHMGLVDNTKNRTLIQTKLKELGLGEVQVKFVVANAPPGWIRPAPDSEAPPSRNAPPASTAGPSENAARAPDPTRPGSQDDFRNDPLIKKALDLFRGTIVEVRS